MFFVRRMSDAMMGAREKVSYRIAPSVRDAVRKVADERRCAESNVVRDALEAYIRREGELDQLANLEQRMAGSLTRLMKDVRTLRNDMHLTMAFVNTLAELYLLHTPPLPADAKDAASASAVERHQKYIRRVVAQLQGGEGLWADLVEPPEAEAVSADE